MLGTRSLSIPAVICIVSDAASPIVIFPPIVKSPDTSKFPVIDTLSLKLILPDASIFKSPDSDSTMFELNFTFPVWTFDPSIVVVLEPSVKVTPVVVSILKFAFVKFTVPVC